ncbi:MAG: anaerobic ribonucleoside-triphosphate reductase activating protein [Desulfomonile tiedjei]|uniref:Anaerobic ribonucleoside-triphosphate reductase activating protein n=1 Tax=Desulfomonile tiedjei TaxID=2358 RepID=A0A9D6V183_9BACT|nr:anaerobic ribonucleoside-triphosphate reductase activating protein [Desulfomonile tiedjei]
MRGIKGFIPSSLIDWPGKLCSVVFLGGCGFRCPACHNSRLVLEPASLPDYPLDQVLSNLRARRGWIDGITVTGGEPTARKELPDLLRTLRKTGTRIKLDSNGSNPSMLKELIGRRLIDAVYMDVKAPLNMKEYSAVAGVPIDIRIIKRSIGILKRSDLEVVFRTTAVPGLVEEPQIREIRDALGPERPFVLQFFRNSSTLDPEFSKVEEFPQGRIENMRAEFESATRRPEPLANAG